MRMITKLSTLALAAALAAPLGVPGTLAQDNAGSASQVQPCELGPDLSDEALRAIEDQNERLRMLSCMIGTPRDYQGELAQRQPGGEIRAVDVEAAWGKDVVAEGLKQSAEANAAATGELQAAVDADEELSGFLKTQGYRSLGVIGYRINVMDGSTDVFLAATAGAEHAESVAGAIDETVEGTVDETPESAMDEDVDNEAMAESMEEAIEEEMEEGAGSSQ